MKFNFLADEHLYFDGQIFYAKFYSYAGTYIQITNDTLNSAISDIRDDIINGLYDDSTAPSDALFLQDNDDTGIILARCSYYDLPYTTRETVSSTYSEICSSLEYEGWSPDDQLPFCVLAVYRITFEEARNPNATYYSNQVGSAEYILFVKMIPNTVTGDEIIIPIKIYYDRL